MPEFTLQVCGLAIRLASDDARLLASARKRYAPFRFKGSENLLLELSVTDRLLRPDLDEPRVVWQGKSVRVERHDLELDLARGRGRAILVRGARPFDSLLRIALSFELLKRGGFLCHSAAVDGWLFPGLSGAGKSTLGRAVPRKRLLADELVGVVGHRLWGTPFRGDFLPGKNPASHPVKAIVLLDRRAPRGVRSVSKTAALVRLLQCALHFSDDPGSAQAILDIARRLVRQARTLTLSYDARVTAWADLESQLLEALS